MDWVKALNTMCCSYFIYHLPWNSK